jgi:uncharacterized protein YbaR (Trm112 family)
MRGDLLDLLRCPYCGGAFTAGDSAAGAWTHAVLSCACCAYPVVDGIPILKLGDEVSAAIRAVERGDVTEARRLVLDLPLDRHDAFERVAGAHALTFAEAVRRILPDGEGDYYALRFGDPVFVAADTVVRTIGRRIPEATGRLVDVCGGCGHLTWTMRQVAFERRWPEPVLLDASFWRLSLARRFVVGEADVICADANHPLPLVSGAATLAVCNDAAHYVWSKRTLATDMMRVAGPRGWVAWTHVHSALGGNVTAGNTLAPSHYAALLGDRRVLAATDDALLDAAIAGHALPWGSAEAAAGSTAGAITLVAPPHGGDLMLQAHPPPLSRGRVVAHPCYSQTREAGTVTWRIAMPSPEYEAEFGALRRYLPEQLDWHADETDDLERLARQRPDLIARRVLLQVPPEYL